MLELLIIFIVGYILGITVDEYIETHFKESEK